MHFKWIYVLSERRKSSFLLLLLALPLTGVLLTITSTAASGFLFSFLLYGAWYRKLGFFCGTQKITLLQMLFSVNGQYGLSSRCLMWVTDFWGPSGEFIRLLFASCEGSGNLGSGLHGLFSDSQLLLGILAWRERNLQVSYGHRNAAVLESEMLCPCVQIHDCGWQNAVFRLLNIFGEDNNTKT